MTPPSDASGSGPAPALIAVLAGGRGERLGGDKPGAPLAGRPLIAHALAAARAAAGGPAPIVVAKPDTRLPPLPERVVREAAEPVHPLCGIATALHEAGGRAVVVVGGDMPFLEPGLLAWLAALPDPLAVPFAGGRLHPLLARYGPELLPHLEKAMGDEAPLRETVAALGPREIGVDELAHFGDPELLLLNVNTQEQLEAAERIARERNPAG